MALMMKLVPLQKEEAAGALSFFLSRSIYLERGSKEIKKRVDKNQTMPAANFQTL